MSHICAPGEHGSLQEAAQTELQPLNAAPAPAALADRWWDIGTGENGPARLHAQLHAAKLYRSVVGQMGEGLTKAKVQHRLLNQLARSGYRVQAARLVPGR